jgi:AcrR family transcriptional regulator
LTPPRTAHPGRKRLTRAEQKARTRRLLIEAAGDVFRRRGFSGSSVEEIAETAGFTRGAFYSNFDSKEQLFIELLHDRVYDQFRGIIENAPRTGSARDQLLSMADALRRVYEESAERWIFELWLECLAHAARHSEFAELPATFWSGNRAVGAEMIERVYRDADASPPVEPRHLASAMIALDIGLAIQNLVDPKAVPLRLYPELYELLFGQLLPEPS